MFGVSLGMILLIGVLIFLTKQTNAGEIEAEAVDGVTTKVLENKIINYTTATQELKISSSEGLKEELVSVKLDTPISNKVGIGYVMVAKFTVSPKTDISSFIKQIQFYNLKDGAREVTKQVDIKYLSVGTKQIDDYETTCTKTELKNGTIENNCVDTLVGKHFEDEWLPYNYELKSDVPITIGLFADVQYGEQIEWIPTFTVTTTDVRVTEWATWTADLNTGLVSYYKFEEAAGNFVDSVGSNNLAVSGTVGRVTGKIGNGVEFNDNDANYLESLNNIGITGAGARTSCWWSERDTTTNEDIFLSWGLGSNYRRWMPEYYDSATYYLIVGTYGYDIKTGVSQGTTYSFNCVTFNGTMMKWWVNGASISNVTLTQTMDTGDSHLWVGYNNLYTAPFDGVIDELGIWNIELGGSAIVQLYNGGTGITYGAYCNFTGYVKDSTGTGLSGASVVIFNQDLKSDIYNTTTSANGLWNIDILNSTKNFTAVAYLNNSLIGSAKPFISGTC